MALAMASNAACLMAIRIMSEIWGHAALVASHRKSSGCVCGHDDEDALKGVVVVFSHRAYVGAVIFGGR